MSMDIRGSGTTFHTVMEPYQKSIKKNFRRNYVANVLEGGIYIGGGMFLAAETVLPKMVESMGGSDWLIALMPAMFRLGFLLPPLFTAHYVEKLPRMMPFVTVLSLIQRLPYPIVALLLFRFTDMPILLLVAVAAAPFVSGFFCGVSLGAWMEMIARVIPARRRASLWAFRNMVVAVIGICAGHAVKVILDRYPGTQGYAWLHVAVSIALFVSFGVFLFIREPEMPVSEKKHNESTLVNNLKSLPSILRGDQVFRNFIISRVIGMSIYVMLPFLPLYACEITKSPESLVGALVMSQMAGSFVGNMLAGYLGDKMGGRVLLLTARIIFLASFSFAFFTETVFGFYVIYWFYGFAATMDQVGSGTLSVEIFPEKRRPTYFSLQQFIVFPTLILASLGGPVVRKLSGVAIPAEWGLFKPALALALIGAALSYYYTTLVPEPRKKDA